jgi:ABC-type antimicrobial peptide transport system permease subunit
MSAGLFPILMVVTIGLIAGSGLGLGIGYLAGKQKVTWAEMTRKDRFLSVALVFICSAIVIGGLTWQFLLQ